MGKNPSFKDYGGNSYTRGRRYRTKIKDGKFLTHRCRDCDTLRYTSPLEWTRATKPHCLKCGGPLVETVESEKRTLGTKTERRRVAANNVRPKSAYKCWSCGFRCDAACHLAAHLSVRKDCVSEYVADKKITGGFLAGTAGVESVPKSACQRPWRMCAVNRHGVYDTVEFYPSKSEAQTDVDAFNAEAGF